MNERFMSELEQCCDGMDDFGRDLLLQHAHSLMRLRPAPRPRTSLRLISGGATRAGGGNQSDVLNLGQSEPLILRG